MKKIGLLRQFKAKNKQKKNETKYICYKKLGINIYTLKTDKARSEYVSQLSK